MLASGAVRQLLMQAADLVAHGKVPWAALTVWGFADAPVSWGLEEHHFGHGGAENDYTLVLLPAGRWLLRSALRGEIRAVWVEA